MAQSADTETRIKVFVSYSRADKAFASDLVLGLAACGFAPYIDRQDIAAGEDWEKRLAGLITEADTVVYVISPDSLKSENCAEEFQQALALRKRILPVVWRAVDDAAAPPEMKRLNYIFFCGEGRTFAAGLAELAAALRTDIDWIREHTRLTELSRRWSARGRASELLLRGHDIDAANTWLTSKPITAPAITDGQADFIKASSDARAEAERRAKRARAGLLTAVSVAAVIFAGLAGVAGWQSLVASEARDREVAANEGLRSANTRLSAEVWLRTAPSDNGYYVINSNWYPVVAGYSGAVARVTRSGGGHETWQQSGFIIDGGLLHPRYAGESLLVFYAAEPSQRASPVFWRQPPVSAPADTLPADARGNPRIATPDDTLPADAPPDRKILAIEEMEENDRRAREGLPPIGATPPPPDDTLTANDPDQVQHYITDDPIDPGPERITVEFPVLGGTATPLTASELLWKTPVHLGAEEPFQIWRLSAKPPFGSVAVAKKDVDCQDFGATAQERTVALLTVAMPNEDGPSPKALALNISQMLDRTTAQEMYYTHSTNRMSGGAPVFDLFTRSIFAVHIGSDPDPQRPGFRRGKGYSFRHLLDMARSSVKDAELGPVCGG